MVGLRHFLIGYQLKEPRTSVSSSWERKGGLTLPHMFYLATVLLFRVIDVSVDIISEIRSPHHQPTDCTLLWRNVIYSSSSTSLFFSSCSFTAGCVIVHLHGELTDGTFTLPLRVCNSLPCWVEGGGSLFSALLLTHNNFQLVLICIPYYHFRCSVGGGGAWLHLHTLSYLAGLSMQGLFSFFKNKYSIAMARPLCSPLLPHSDKRPLLLTISWWKLVDCELGLLIQLF